MNKDKLIELIDNFLENNSNNNIFELPSHLQMKNIRIINNFSMGDIQNQTGVSKSTISRLEAGKEVEFKNWYKLCEFYKTLI